MVNNFLKSLGLVFPLVFYFDAHHKLSLFVEVWGLLLFESLFFA